MADTTPDTMWKQIAEARTALSDTAVSSFTHKSDRDANLELLKSTYSDLLTNADMAQLQANRPVSSEADEKALRDFALLRLTEAIKQKDDYEDKIFGDVYKAKKALIDAKNLFTSQTEKIARLKKLKESGDLLSFHLFHRLQGAAIVSKTDKAMQLRVQQVLLKNAIERKDAYVSKLYKKRNSLKDEISYFLSISGLDANDSYLRNIQSLKTHLIRKEFEDVVGRFSAHGADTKTVESDGINISIGTLKKLIIYKQIELEDAAANVLEFEAGARKRMHLATDAFRDAEKLFTSTEEKMDYIKLARNFGIELTAADTARILSAPLVSKDGVDGLRAQKLNLARLQMGTAIEMGASIDKNQQPTATWVARARDFCGRLLGGGKSGKGKMP